MFNVLAPYTIRACKRAHWDQIAKRGDYVPRRVRC
jgi:hypothetical protein